MARAATTAPESTIKRRDRNNVFAAWPDERLLRRFVSSTDGSAEAAFAVLIERHGPMVHRVCWDVLRDPEEAQDAAQAVFLVLARKACSIRKPEALGAWLHGVALRVARRARSEAARRRTAERRKAETMPRRQSPSVTPDPSGDDHAELHEEVDRLPEKYRTPIVLCYLQGKSQAEAAEALGWPLGTVQVRLHRGRERLRSRLTRRGVAGALGLVGYGLATSLPASASAWTDATASAAVRFAAGKETSGLVAPAVASLAESTLTAMLRSSLKVVAATAISLLLASGFFLWTGPSTRAVALAANRAEPRPKAIARNVPTKTAPAKAAPVRERSEARPAPPLLPLDDPDRPTTPASPDLALADARSQDASKDGRALFERVWVKDDRHSHGGDGLGPVFNGASCVACHHLGGTGGAGGVDRNIEIASVTDQLADGSGYFYAFSMDFGAGSFQYRFGNNTAVAPRNGPRVDSRLLAAIHPGFREARSVVLHHYGTDPDYNTWRGSVPGVHGAVLVRTSERNPPALFGAGLIDALPDEAIEAAAKRKFPGSSTVKGRISRLKDGRIGRFGWKSQTATLKEFVLSAAAGEMGLEVPGRPQAADPRLPGLAATGLDMDESECKALTEYVRALPAPITIEPADDQESAQLKSGEETFKTIGCTHCHLPKLGGIDGIYSDLLLHDMSPRLGDADAYSVFVGDAPKPKPEAPDPLDRSGAGLATAPEWRTPPLWGLRDSAPYLHDGRAATIDQAIAAHAGQGASSAKRYAELSPRRKRHVTVFLRSLGAPAAR